jgi:hypothetical protein
MSSWSNSVPSFCFVFGLGVALVWAAPQSANIPATTIPAGGYRIAGTVVSKADGRPLARARVTITDAKDSKKFEWIITSEDGKYDFRGLPAGKYSLTGAKRGFISASYDQHDQFSTAIVTGAGLDTESLLLRLAPDAVISGKVLDETNEPVRNARVTLYFDDHSAGVDQIRQSRSAETNDLGEYELTPLRPGTYYLSASGTPWYAVHPRSDQGQSGSGDAATMVERSLDVAYPTTYYPDVAEADDAMPIPIRGGERMEADIHLSPVPSLRLLFRVPDKDKQSFFPELQQPAFDGYTDVQGLITRGPSGLAEITGVPAGRYNVSIHGQGQTLQMNGVDVSKDGEEIDTSKGEASSTVKLSVQVPREATPSERLSVGLRSGSRVVSVAQVDSKGEAELQQVAAGKYEAVVWGSGRRYSVARMSAEGAQVSGHILSVAAGSAPSVSLTVVTGSAEVQGTVTRAGKGFAGAMVVLAPKNLEMDRDLFRRDQSDLDGTFLLRGVVPGSYTLLAIENGWDLDWSQPGVIAAYLKHGRRIEVGDQNGGPINVTEAIEVQSK